MKRLALVFLLVSTCFAGRVKEPEYHFVPVKHLVHGSPYKKVFTVGEIGGLEMHRVKVCDINSEVTCVTAVLRNDMKKPDLYADVSVYGEYHDKQVYVEKLIVHKF